MKNRARGFGGVIASAASLAAITCTVALLCSCESSSVSNGEAPPQVDPARIDFFHDSDPRTAALREEMSHRIETAMGCQPQPPTLQQQADALRGLIEEECRWLTFCDSSEYFRGIKWSECPEWRDFIVTATNLRFSWESAIKVPLQPGEKGAQYLASTNMAICRELLPKVHAVRRILMRAVLDDVFKVPTAMTADSQARTRAIAPERSIPSK